ncbi:aminomethyl-transferring glycine dehydrogenase subunit GcvPB [Actinobaculum suis]|uniref:aminomethyl-transferring glycine dehydrogenase subunit GcvPB n=1 Tax=Actinobaculum suis TaxID=1657 RepID=UPI0009F698B2|nr:aminomethyl-transferring glycine dehydrogenase subunit GcvPB [Actinobaculum suis]
MAAFVTRHIGTTPAERVEMAQAAGYENPEALFRAALPEFLDAKLDAAQAENLPQAVSEPEVLAELREIASRNTVRKSFIGQGYYGTHMPAVIQRNIFENPSWYTSYTPYQPEISQGRLEALLNFQTMVADLTGLDIANASLLDEATAVVEAMLLARRAGKKHASNVFLVDASAFPQTRAVLARRARAVGIELVEFDPDDTAGLSALPPAFGAFLQYPGGDGEIRDPRPLISAVHKNGGLAIIAADLLALTLLESPGELGADIAVGTTQRFGIPMSFGGPHAGYMAVRDKLKRQLPGRLVSISHDTEGKASYRLALQTREQHIRREKATSNICTAQALLAVMAGMYAVYHGPAGITAIARRVAGQAQELADIFRAGGYQVLTRNFFDTFRVEMPGQAETCREKLAQAGYLAYGVDANTLSFSCDETTTPEDLAAIQEVLAALPAGTNPQCEPMSSSPAAAPAGGATANSAPETAPESTPHTTHTAAASTSHAAAATETPLVNLPAELRRHTPFLEAEVFHKYHSETAFMRYLKQLADRDYALDRGMIPLGSCTMKLNAATEMAAITWPEFTGLHPFAPAGDAAGSLQIIADLEKWLAALTGYDAVTLQPNSGAHGELTGLLTIRAYLESRGEAHRDVCLIPASAHGTNAASAVLAGLRVVVVSTSENGDIDLDDLRAKIEQYGSELAALMVTYPSTHGVFEAGIRKASRLVHEAGGQVYIDGANFNALAGAATFTELGGDVSHLNLHKTFAIPHGGGGPGVGPVGARAHLAPFLPGHPQEQVSTHAGKYVYQSGPVAAAPYGSPGVLPITWAYIRLLGAAGLREATQAAVLAANYISHKLSDSYQILYTGRNGLVAHECIIDLRPLRASSGITVDDVAKRLVDYGFHAPTMSFPVSGTLMVEPTESEPLAELDRFIAAMEAIREEIRKVETGQWPAEDNPLKQAPFTAASVITSQWDHPFTREQAAYPAGPAQVDNKYWPPVRRIDQAYGDRNLVCVHPSPAN